jgi:hypothetical protein
MLPSQFLAKAKEGLLDPNAWTKGVYAKPASNVTWSCTADDPRAACFCVMGKILNIAKHHNYVRLPESHPARAAINYLNHSVAKLGIYKEPGSITYPGQEDRIEKRILVNSVSWYNDLPETTHADILQILDDARSLAEAHEEYINNAIS